MIYKFSDALNLNYSQLEKYVINEELTKNELLDICSGEIDYELFMGLKELAFDKIGRTVNGELYLV